MPMRAPVMIASTGAPVFSGAPGYCLLQKSINASSAALCLTDAQTRIVYANEAFSRLSGYSRTDVIGKPVRQFLASTRLSGQVFRKALKKIRQGYAYETELLLTRQNGLHMWVHLNSSPVFASDGRVRHMLNLFTDITRAKLHEVLQCAVMEAMLREQPLDQVMSLLCREIERMAPDTAVAILRTGRDGRLQPLAGPTLPAEFLHSLGTLDIRPDTRHGEAVRVADIRTDPQWTRYSKAAQALGLHACWPVPVRNRDGCSMALFAIFFRTCRGPDPLHSQLIAIGSHLVLLALERDETHHHIRRMAFYDALTGLPNRSQLLSRANQILADMRAMQSGMAVLFVDLDRFKQVNDALGHACGDDLLRIVAERLRNVVRDSDLVGRLSGDEFVLVLPHCGASQVAPFLERLRTMLNQPVRLGEARLSLSASIGVSLYPKDGADMTSLLRHADAAMYRAKRLEHGGFRFFSEIT